MFSSITPSRPSRRTSRSKVSALARERIGGLQSITAEPPKPRVTMVGHRWDTACGDLRRFLARNQISFNWLTPDAPELAALWPGPRPPGRRWPGAALRRRRDDRCDPQVRDLANRLGLQTSPRVGRIRRRDRRRRAGRPCGGGLRRIGRAAHDRRRARGARRAGRNVVAHRELSRVSQRRLRRRACKPRAAAGKAARGGNPGHALGRRHRSGDARGVPRRRRRRPGTDPHSRHRRDMAAPRHRRASIGSSARASTMAPRAARRAPPMGRTSTSSAPETRPARRRCTLPTTRAR